MRTPIYEKILLAIHLERPNNLAYYTLNFIWGIKEGADWFKENAIFIQLPMEFM